LVLGGDLGRDLRRVRVQRAGVGEQLLGGGAVVGGAARPAFSPTSAGVGSFGVVLWIMVCSVVVVMSGWLPPLTVW